jgi:hypothetical protein
VCWRRHVLWSRPRIAGKKEVVPSPE